eukprot:scaffold1373_cov367-Pinguiococcus_pyrenoidosus.AAC.5
MRGQLLGGQPRREVRHARVRGDGRNGAEDEHPRHLEEGSEHIQAHGASPRRSASVHRLPRPPPGLLRQRVHEAAARRDLRNCGRDGHPSDAHVSPQGQLDVSKEVDGPRNQENNLSKDRELREESIPASRLLPPGAGRPSLAVCIPSKATWRSAGPGRRLARLR